MTPTHMLVNNVESEFTTHRRMEATDRTTLCPINPMVTAVQRIKERRNPRRSNLGTATTWGRPVERTARQEQSGHPTVLAMEVGRCHL